MNTPASIQAEDDIQAAKPPAIARAAGSAVIGAGALAMLVAIQTLTGFWVRRDFQIGLAVLAALGVACVVIGLKLMRARAATAGVACAGALLFGASIWLVFSLGNGLVSLFALSAPPAAFVATVLAAAAIGPCRRVSAARARLAAQGLDMGM